MANPGHVYDLRFWNLSFEILGLKFYVLLLLLPSNPQVIVISETKTFAIHSQISIFKHINSFRVGQSGPPYLIEKREKTFCTYLFDIKICLEWNISD